MNTTFQTFRKIQQPTSFRHDNNTHQNTLENPIILIQKWTHPETKEILDVVNYPEYPDMKRLFNDLIKNNFTPLSHFFLYYWGEDPEKINKIPLINGNHYNNDNLQQAYKKIGILKECQNLYDLICQERLQEQKQEQGDTHESNNPTKFTEQEMEASCINIFDAVSNGKGNHTVQFA